MRIKKIQSDFHEALHEVRFFLTKSELQEYEAFLAPFAGKKGPYAKAILFKHIRENAESNAESKEIKSGVERRGVSV